MGLELRQQLKLTQQLVMTPQLQQAIKLLQLSRLELVETIQQELMENPFLEELDPEVVDTAPATDNLDDYESAHNDSESRANEDLMRNADWENYLGEFSSVTKQSMGRELEVPEEGLSFEARLTSKPSLDGHLTWQMRLSNFTEAEIAIGEIIIGNLDSRGYLQASAEEIHDQIPSAPIADIEAVIRRIQRLDPVGVAARSVQECLLVQMEMLGMDRDPHPGVPGARAPGGPGEAPLQAPDQEVPHQHGGFEGVPGSAPDAGTHARRALLLGEPQYVSPDVFVHKHGEDFVIVLNEEGFPRLQLNSYYVENIRAKSSVEKDYFQDKVRSAEWLMKSLYTSASGPCTRSWRA